MTKQTVCLASASPRRHAILALMGVDFIVDAPDVDETLDGAADDVAGTLAMRKAEAVLSRHREMIVLGADTVVDCEGIMGKPRDAADAAAMLRRLSGRWHQVTTGVCTILRGNMRCETAVTQVHFTELTEADIRAYIATGEPMDKAGAYAIQGMGGMFIDRIDGCPHNVMGLPMALARRLLAY